MQSAIQFARILFLLLAILVAVLLDYWLVTKSQIYFERHGVPPETAARLKYLWQAGQNGVHYISEWIGSKISYRVWLLLSLPALGIVIYSFKVYQSNAPLRNYFYWILVFIGVSLFWANWKPAPINFVSGEVISPSYFRNWQAVCIALSLIGTFLASQLAGYQPKSASAITAFVLWLAAILLGIYGVLGKFNYQQIKIDKKSSIRFTSFFLAALLVSSWNIRHIPVFLSGDAGSSGIFALEILSGNFNNPFSVGWFSFPSLYFFLQAIFILVFGQSIEALRYLSAFGGALSVGLVYLMGRRIFNERTGIFAAILMLAFHYHNHFSRIGLNNVWDGFWVLLALGSILEGWLSEKREFYILAGIALGISQYFYASSRLLFVIIPVWLLLIGLLDLKKFKQQWLNITFMIFIAVVIFFPLARFYMHLPNEYLFLLTRVSINSAWLQEQMDLTQKSSMQIITGQILLGLKGFIHSPIIFVYAPKTPLLRFPESVLFILAAGLLLKSLRSSRALLFFLWIGMYGIMVGLSFPTPASQRYIATVPAVMLLLGFGLSSAIDRFSHFYPRFTRIWMTVGVIALLVISVDDLHFYYWNYSRDGSRVDQNGLVAQKLAEYLQSKDSTWEVLFFGSPRMGYYSLSSLPYQAPHIHGIDINQPWDSPGIPQPAMSNLMFVFLPGHESDQRIVESEYPGGVTRTWNDLSGGILFTLYEVQIQ